MRTHDTHSGRLADAAHLRAHDRSVQSNGLDEKAKQDLQAAAGSGVKLSM